jgi:hypothetical protein
MLPWVGKGLIVVAHPRVLAEWAGFSLQQLTPLPLPPPLPPFPLSACPHSQGGCTCSSSSTTLSGRIRVVAESSAPTGGFLGSTITFCSPRPPTLQPVAVCAGQTADPSGVQDASTAIQVGYY